MYWHETTLLAHIHLRFALMSELILLGAVIDQPLISCLQYSLAIGLGSRST